MEEFEIDIIEKKCHTNGAKIKVIGVGGGAGQMINHMIEGKISTETDNYHEKYMNGSLVSNVIYEEDITIDELIEDIKNSPKAISFIDGKTPKSNINLNEKINIALYGTKRAKNKQSKISLTNEIDFIVANTDAQALSSSLAPYKMQLGMNATRGFGAGMIPEKGREAALESFEDIKEMLEGSDIVFIAAGLGGGTGTGATPIIAQAAKEVGALTVSIVTIPFKFEGRKRTKLAKEGLEKLKRESDSIIVVPNEKLLSIVEKNLGIKESFRMVDDILAQAVGSIFKMILSHGKNDINLDFSDVKTVMSHRGLALMGTGYSTGTNAAYDAAKAAIESPLFDNISIDGAMGILVHFDIHPDYPIIEIGEAMNIVEESADKDASVIFGTTTNENMDVDEVRITIVATGFENKDAIAEAASGKPEFLLAEPSASSINTIRSVNKMVVGGHNEENEDILELVSFLRKQMD